MRKMQNKVTSLIILVVLVFLTACTSKEEKDYKVMTCTKNAITNSENTDIEITNKVYYKDNYVKKLVATDKVTSTDSSVIEEYKDAYQKIYSAYDGLKHYSNKITVTKNSMTSVTTIDYAHIDTDKLLKIEGEEDNVVDEEGKVPLEKFIAFYEKYGGKCKK